MQWLFVTRVSLEKTPPERPQNHPPDVSHVPLCLFWWNWNSETRVSRNDKPSPIHRIFVGKLCRDFTSPSTHCGALRMLNWKLPDSSLHGRHVLFSFVEEYTLVDLDFGVSWTLPCQALCPKDGFSPLLLPRLWTVYLFWGRSWSFTSSLVANEVIV